MIRLIVTTFILVFLASGSALAQTKGKSKTKTKTTPPPVVVKPKLPATITFDPFNPEDSLGIAFFKLITDYEKYGHLAAAPGQGAAKDMVNKFQSLFENGSQLPDDLGGGLTVVPGLGIDEYITRARQAGFQHYALFVQPGELTANLDTLTDTYVLDYKVFKLFAAKAVPYQVYEAGAYYTIRLKIADKEKKMTILRIETDVASQRRDFMLGGFGYLGQSPVLVSTSLDDIVRPKPPRQTTYNKVYEVSRSNLFFYGGINNITHLGPESFALNEYQFAEKSGEQSAFSVGIQYQKAFTQKGRLGMILGINYEENEYSNQHDNLSFTYTAGFNNEPLTDLKGNLYDIRYVTVHNQKENGKITYIAPEIGLFYNIFMGSHVNFQPSVTFGHHYQNSTSYSNTAVVSYQGEVLGSGLGPVSADSLGFYTNYEKSLDGELSQAQSFMTYRLRAALDIYFSKRIALTLVGGYAASLTYAIRERTYDYPFFDPAYDQTFESSFNQLAASRNYGGLFFQAGLKIFLKEPRSVK